MGFTVIVPLVLAVVHALPDVVTVKLKVPLAVGVPLMVAVVPLTLNDTPAGNAPALILAPVAPPPKVILIADMAVL